MTDSGFLGTTPTLACHQLGEDALVQVGSTQEGQTNHYYCTSKRFDGALLLTDFILLKQTPLHRQSCSNSVRYPSQLFFKLHTPVLHVLPPLFIASSHQTAPACPSKCHASPVRVVQCVQIAFCSFSLRSTQMASGISEQTTESMSGRRRAREALSDVPSTRDRYIVGGPYLHNFGEGTECAVWRGWGVIG